jgi:hypothetical protein
VTGPLLIFIVKALIPPNQTSDSPVFSKTGINYLIRLRNSLRVRELDRKMPEKAEVVVIALCFSTPRSCMQV